MVIFTDRELEFLVTLRDNWERLYRNELSRLLMEEAERRGRFDVKRMRSRGTGNAAMERADPARNVRTPWTSR
jgi:hypothetical protein